MRRREDDPPPLFAARGLPEDDHWITRETLEDDAQEPFGWLLAREVREAIAHLAVPPEHLSTSTHLLLEVLALLEARYGEERVRIVFGFD